MLFNKVKRLFKNPETRRLVGFLLLMAGAVLWLLKPMEAKYAAVVLVPVGIILLAAS